MIRILCIAILFLMPGGSAAAASQDFKNFESQEQRLRRLEEGMRRPLITPPGEQAPESRPAPLAPSEQGVCVPVDSVAVEGATLISPSALARLTRPFEGRCLTLQEINAVLQTLTNAYVERGYVTTRAVLEPQDLSSGVLRVRVVEGKIESIEPAPESGMDRRQLLTIFPGLRGTPLNLRDIEQGLDQMNRLPSNAASMRIEPGENMGGSRVVINNPARRSWRFITGYDNYGQENTGIPQFTLGLEKDNFLGCQDQFALYFSSTAPPVHEAFKNRWGGKSDSLTGLFSVPFGYWLLSGSFSRFSYSTNIYGLNQTYINAGDTAGARLALDRVLWRDGAGKISLGGFYQFRNVENRIEDVVLLASSYQMSTAGLALSFARRMLGGVLSLQLDQTWGLPDMSRDLPGPVRAATPRSDFRKTSGSLNWQRPFEIGGQSFVWSLSAHAQTTQQTLYGAERVYLGSPHTVRGFRGSPAGGDQGGYARNELAWDVPQSLWSLLHPHAATNVRLFAGWDYGLIVRDEKDPYERGEMQGVVLGLRTSGPLSLEAAWSRPVAYPDYIKKVEDVWYLNIKYTF